MKCKRGVSILKFICLIPKISAVFITPITRASIRTLDTGRFIIIILQYINNGKGTGSAKVQWEDHLYIVRSTITMSIFVRYGGYGLVRIPQTP